jgi:transposase
MAKTFRTYLPEQNLLLPASLREWLPDDHLSYFVSDVVDQLDLSAIVPHNIVTAFKAGKPHQKGVSEAGKRHYIMHVSIVSTLGVFAAKTEFPRVPLLNLPLT